MRQLEFDVTGFYPAFAGAKRARLSEDISIDFFMNAPPMTEREPFTAKVMPAPCPLRTQRLSGEINA